MSVALREYLERLGRRPLMLDGDRLRGGLCKGLGFDDADRTENLRRAAETARLGVESGLITVAAFITPRAQQREMVRAIIGPECVSLVQLNASLEVCRTRDTKGLYRKAKSGEVRLMTGMASVFEFSTTGDLMLDTGASSPSHCVQQLTGYTEMILARLAQVSIC